jgi:hypothetical protein
MYENYVDEEVDDSFYAYLVEGAEFTKDEEYPIINSDMVASKVPTKVMPFSKAISYRGDLSDVVIYFFSPDKTFERVRRNPKKYLSFFRRTAGICGFDYSVHTDMPLVKQKSQMNDNLSLTYYFGKNGVPIYPSPRGGYDGLTPEYLSAFPKGTLLSLGVHGFIKKKYQKHEWIVWIKEIIETLHPSGFIVIGHLDKTIIDMFSKDTKFYLFDSLMDERNKEIKQYVN